MPSWRGIDRSLVLRRRIWMSVFVVLAFCSVATAGAATTDNNGISECTTIEEPGRYVVTQDIQAPADTDICVRVRASDVVLDGAGHRIAGDGSGTVGVGVGSWAGLSNVSVSDLAVTGWRVGVGYGNVDGGSVADVTARQNDDGVRIARSDEVHVSDARLTDNDRAGVRVELGSTDNRLVGTVALDNQLGIVFEQSNGNEIVGGRFDGNERRGIRLHDTTGSTIRGVEIVDSGDYGVSVNDSSSIQLVDTTVRHVGVGIGVVESDDVRIANTTAAQNSDEGIEIRRSSRVDIRSTVLTHNEWSGVYVERGDDVRMTNVTASENRRSGIALWDVDTWHVTDSVAVDNRQAGIGPTASDEGIVTGNRIAGNDQGVWATGTNNTLVNNVVERNAFGFLVSLTGRGYTELRNNTIVDNSEYGISASGAAVGRFVIANSTIRQNGEGYRDRGYNHGGVIVSNSVDVKENRIVDNDGIGVEMQTSGSTVADNLIARNTYAGVELEGTTNATISDNDLTANEYGVRVGYGQRSDRQGRSITPSVSTTIEYNRIAENRRANVLVQGANDTWIRDNALVGSEVGVRIEPITFLGSGQIVDATATEVHENLISDNRAFGVENRGRTVVDARRNDWGAPSGPSSSDDIDGLFTDPVTGVVADGEGDAVSENRTVDGVSNVRFDPFLESANVNGLRNYSRLVSARRLISGTVV